MKRRVQRAICAVIVAAATVPALAHECRAVGNGNLRGSYQGDCDESTELPQGRGEAKGIDTYVGNFVKGMPDGKGTYTWQNGARLEGAFKRGKANGPGIYVSAQGVRYEGVFQDGKLPDIKKDDCPATVGPISC